MKRGRGRKQQGWFSRSRAWVAGRFSGSLFAEGWGLPITGFVVTLLIAVTVFLAFLHSANIRTMTAFDWGIIGAAAAFFSQFGANCCLLRFNRIEWEEPNKTRKVYVFIAFFIFSAGSAYGIHHAQTVYRESGYETERSARATEVTARDNARRPIEQRRDEAQQRLADAANILAQIGTTTGVSADRTTSRADAARDAIRVQGEIVTQANRDLAPLPKLLPLPEQRPWDNIDTALAIFCTLLALLEFFIYSSLHPRKKREPVVEPVHEEPQIVHVESSEPLPMLTDETSNVTVLRQSRAPRTPKRVEQRGASWSDARNLLDRK